MSERTYHVSVDGMTAFIGTLEKIMEPYETHCRRYLLLLEKMNEQSYSVSSKGVQIVMQSVAMFPDLRDVCEKTLNGFADLADTQAQLFEAAQDINEDVASIQKGYINLIRTLIESCRDSEQTASAARQTLP